MNDKLANARAHLQASRLGEAETLCRDILDADPDNADALHLYGVCAFQAGRGADAVELIERALEIQPDFAKALNNLGNVLKALGRVNEAFDRYEAALSLEPDFSEALVNRGGLWQQQGRPEEAAQDFEKALSLNPDFAEAHAGLAGALRNLDRGADAAESYRWAIKLMPGHPELHFNLANTLKDLGRTEGSIEIYEAALSLKPDFIEARVNMGAALSSAGRLDDAAACCEAVFKLRPSDPYNLCNLGLAYQELGRLRESAKCFDIARASDPTNRRTANNALHALLYDPDLGNDVLYGAIRQIADLVVGSEKAASAPKFVLEKGERLRIGYLSSDFRVHPVGLNLRPLLANHNHELFKIFCYAEKLQPDDLTKEFRAHADQWHELGGLTDTEAADKIRADNIHIMVYAGGHFDENRPWVANLNPAPLQVSFHGGATTGLEEMDAWFTDAILHPDDTTERFTEDLVRLPNFYAYPTQDNAPEVANLPADTNGFITFISFNKPCKMNESVLDLWSEILKVVPGSRLMLKYRNYLGVPSLRQRVLSRFEANGVSADLIELRSAVDNFEEHMAGYHRADIALDTFPFAGATTTFQALWMGVPVISFMGDRFISRAGGSISTQAGLGELAVDTPEKYIETARALAADLPRLRGLRSGLRQRMATSPLCDGPAYACAVENAFRSLWADKFGGGS